MTDPTVNPFSNKELSAGEQRYRTLADSSRDGIIVSLNNRIVFANHASVHILGVSHIAHLIGRSLFEVADQDFHSLLTDHPATALNNKQDVPAAEVRWRRKDDQVLHVQCISDRVLWDGRPATQWVLRDVTELTQTQHKLRLMRERLKLATERTGESIWDWDIENKSFIFSGGLKSTLGRTEDEIHGTESEWHKIVHPEDLPSVIAAFQATINGETPVYEKEYRIKSRDRRWKWVRARGIIVERDQHGKPLIVTGTLTDITARKESDELIWRHANLDPLTGLPNRRLFRERLDFELLKAKRTGHHLALLFIDLDGFKQINDLYGHDVGDLLLMEAAHRIRNCVRETDTVARIGDDEFTVALTALDDSSNAEVICQKILVCLSQSFQVGNEIAFISASIGLSLYPMDGASASELLRKADQAMYTAKKEGKNQFSYFTEAMDEKAHRRLRIINELRNALNQDQLQLHYQPVVDLAGGRIMKAEALLRWQHPVLGAVEPSVFIPLAEESGLIADIGDWVFKQAALCSKRWSERTGSPFQISINKSPLQFAHGGSHSDWLGFLKRLGLPGSSISIEITEGLLLHASPNVVDRLYEYRDAGIQVAIDDFGTGYSSMAYLQKFHIDYLKIDQSFVRNITTDASSRTIAETMILMAHKLGLKVIAEGIETLEQRECLARAGCDFGQGYLFSRPLPAEQLEFLLRHKR